MTVTAPGIIPVEYAVAVDRYLAEAGLGTQSRRVYRISLTSWTWPLAGQRPPDRANRRQARPPVIPLALLEHEDASSRLADAAAYRTRQAGIRTLNRELSALRSAVSWWQRRQWISADPTALLLPGSAPAPSVAPLTDSQRATLFGLAAGLREQAFWHLVADNTAPAEVILGLDAGAVHPRAGRARSGRQLLTWGPRTGELLSWLLGGRRSGPVFLTDRRAPAGTEAADVCPLSGRGRLSYRRAAEIFTEHTRTLDPHGRGWTLHQLRPARQPGPSAPEQS